MVIYDMALLNPPPAQECPPSALLPPLMISYWITHSLSVQPGSEGPMDHSNQRSSACAHLLKLLHNAQQNHWSRLSKLQRCNQSHRRNDVADRLKKSHHPQDSHQKYAERREYQRYTLKFGRALRYHRGYPSTSTQVSALKQHMRQGLIHTLCTRASMHFWLTC